MIKRKKILIIIFLLVSLSGFVFAGEEWTTEINWPSSPTGITPGSEMGIAELTAYFYEWAIVLGIIAAFGILIYASFLYLISTGSTKRMADAKEKMSSAFLGLLLLFGSWLLLSLLNPELTFISDLNVSDYTVPLAVVDREIKAPDTTTEDDLCDYVILTYTKKGEGEIKHVIIDPEEDLFKEDVEPLFAFSCKKRDDFNQEFIEREEEKYIQMVKAKTLDGHLSPKCPIECSAGGCGSETLIEKESLGNNKYCYLHIEERNGTSRSQKSIKYISQNPQSIETSCLAGDSLMKEGGGCSINFYTDSFATRCGGQKISETTPAGSNVSQSYDREIKCVEITRRSVVDRRDLPIQF